MEFCYEKVYWPQMEHVSCAVKRTIGGWFGRLWVAVGVALRQLEGSAMQVRWLRISNYNFLGISVDFIQITCFLQILSFLYLSNTLEGGRRP